MRYVQDVKRSQVLSEPVSATIIVTTIAAVVVVSLFGIVLVNKFKG